MNPSELLNVKKQTGMLLYFHVPLIKEKWYSPVYEFPSDDCSGNRFKNK